MADSIDFEAILKRNVQVDKAALGDSREMLRRLREMGLRRKGYDLVPPFGGRQASVRDSARHESRLIRLTSRRGDDDRCTTDGADSGPTESSRR